MYLGESAAINLCISKVRLIACKDDMVQGAMHFALCMVCDAHA